MSPRAQASGLGARLGRAGRAGVVVLTALAAAAAGVLSGPAAHAQRERPAPSVPVEQPVTEPAADPAQTARSGEYWIDELDLQKVWKQGTGRGVTVAVIDTGVDGEHQDLEDNVLEGKDVSGSGDERGWKGLGAEPSHGTLVASMIAGHGHGGKSSSGPGGRTGMLGTAPEAKILPISVWMGPGNPAERTVEEQIPDAVRAAVDGGADVINLSVGSAQTMWPREWDDAFAYAQEHDVVLVASAGNRGSGVTQVGAPSTIPGVLSVGGVDRQGRASEESSSQGISIAVSAPSEDLVGALPDDGYAYWDGTSGAAPMVSGIAAVLRERYPEESAEQIIARITQTARDEGEPGRDPLYGFGVIDPLAALDEDVDVAGVTENPLGSVRQWAAIHRRAQIKPEEGEEATEAPEHHPDEQIAAVAAPEAQQPRRPAQWLPAVVILAFGLWLGVLLVGTLHRLDALIRRGRGGAGRGRDRE